MPAVVPKRLQRPNSIPIGIIAIALAFAFMPDVRPGVRDRLDFLGVALLTAGLFGVVFGLLVILLAAGAVLFVRSKPV